MDKAALDKINQVNLEHLLAVTATSKTSLGIEQSGVTRDTSKVMRDQLTSDAGIPGLTFIIEALNQDYKRYYPAEYKKNAYRLYIDSPLKTDREAEGKDIENRTSGAELYQTMRDKGYNHKTAAEYALGKIDLDDIGEPTEEPKPRPVPPALPAPAELPKPEAKPKNENGLQRVAHETTVTCRCCEGVGEHDTGAECYRCDASGVVTPIEDEQPIPCEAAPAANSIAPVRNQLAEADPARLASQEAALMNTIQQIEEQVALAVLSKLTKNVYDDSSDVITDDDREEHQRQLFNAMLVFLSLYVPLQAQAAMKQRSQQYGKPGTFTVDTPVRKAVDQAATKAADSHIGTIVEDLRQTVKQTMITEGDLSRVAEAVAKKYPGVTADELKASVREAAKGGKSDSEIAQALRAKYKDADFEDLLAGVRQAALAGAEHDQLVTAVRQEYHHISQTRAKVIAKTETNRAFSMSQYQADRQFLDQNGWSGQAYKKWVCRGPSPCPLCLAKQAEPAIPFGEPFVRIGDTVMAQSTGADGTVMVHAYPITYEDVYAGDIHPNGHCGYELEIR
jgi:hypothetical protein